MTKIKSIFITYEDDESVLFVPELDNGAAEAPSLEEVATPSRRRPNKIGNPEGTSVPEMSQAEVEAAVADRRRSRPTGSSSTIRSRSRGDVRGASTTTVQSSDAPSTAPAQGGRRSRPTSGATAAPFATKSAAGDTAPSPTTVSGSRTRRRDAPAPTASGTTASPSDDISDADMSKACSQHASRIGPNEVLRVVKEFGAKMVSDIPGDKRRAFLDRLKAIK